MIPDESPILTYPRSSASSTTTSSTSPFLSSSGYETSSAKEPFHLPPPPPPLSSSTTTATTTAATSSTTDDAALLALLLKRWRSSKYNNPAATMVGAKHARLCNVLVAVLSWVVSKSAYLVAVYGVHAMMTQAKQRNTGLSLNVVMFLLLLGSVLGQVLVGALLHVAWSRFVKHGRTMHAPGSVSAGEPSHIKISGSAEDSKHRTRRVGAGDVRRAVQHMKRRLLGGNVRHGWKSAMVDGVMRAIAMWFWMSAVAGALGPLRVVIVEYAEYIVASIIIMLVATSSNMVSIVGWNNSTLSALLASIGVSATTSATTTTSSSSSSNGSGISDGSSSGSTTTEQSSSKNPRRQQKQSTLVVLLVFTLLFIILAGNGNEVSNRSAQQDITDDVNGDSTSRSVIFPNFGGFWSIYGQFIGVSFLVMSMIFDSIRKMHSNQVSKPGSPKFSADQGDIFLQSCLVAMVCCLPFMIVHALFNMSILLLPFTECLYLMVQGFLLITLPRFSSNFTRHILSNPRSSIFSSSPVSSLDNNGSGLPTTADLSNVSDGSGNKSKSAIELLLVRKKHFRFSFMVLSTTVLSFMIFGFAEHFHVNIVLALGFLVYAERNTRPQRHKHDHNANNIQYYMRYIGGSGGPGNNSLSKKFQEYMRFIVNDRDSRNLFLFFLLNIMFMLVELVYGFMTNSLGLITDSAHMLFDCSALAIGLYGSYMSKWKPNEIYTFGYGRFETLSAFVNGLLLVFVAFYVLMESMHRLLDPPVVEGDKLLMVSVIGFLINLLGVFFFHQDHITNENTYGVYLHMLADTLGSVGVISSTLIIQYLGWYAADPICSFIISLLIFTASVPLLTNSVQILIQRWPSGSEHALKRVLKTIATEWRGVTQVQRCHFWTLDNDYNVGSLVVRVRSGVDQQEMLQRVTNTLRDKCRIRDVTVQIEVDKDASLEVEETKSTAGHQHHNYHDNDEEPARPTDDTNQAHDQIKS